MYAVSSGYKTAIEANDRKYRLTGTMTLKDGTVYQLGESSFLGGSLSIDWDGVNGEELGLGAVFASQVKGTLIGLSISRYVLYDARIVLNFELYVSSAWEVVPLGIFTVTEALVKGAGIEITAIDDMYKLDVPMSSKAFAGTPYSFLSAISTATEVPLAQTRAQIEALPNGKRTIEIPKTAAIGNWRDLLCYVSQVLAGFSVIDRAGKLVVRNFGKTSVATISKSRCYSLSPADYESFYTSVSVESGTDVIVVNGSTNNGLNLAVRENPLFDVGEITQHYDTVGAIYTAISAIRYVPGEWSYAGNPALDVGDLVTINSVKVLITSTTFKYHAPQAIRSVGANPRYGSIVPINERRQHEAKVLTLEEISRIKGELVDVNAQIVRTQNEILLWVDNKFVGKDEVDGLRSSILELGSQIEISANQILSLVSETYTERSQYSSEIEQLRTAISQNVASITMAVSSLTSQISGVDDKLTQRFEDFETSMTIDAAGVHIRKSVNGKFGRYEVFIDEASFRIREITTSAPSSNPASDSAAVAWISEDNFHIYNADIVNALTIGKFRWEPRTSGNLSLTWTG